MQWLDELKEPAQLKPWHASLAEVAARLQRTTRARPMTRPPGWRRTGHARPPRAALRADPVHKRVNPVLYRAAEVDACWRAITAPTLWVEGADTQVLRWWGGRYRREDFEARLAQVAQPAPGAARRRAHAAPRPAGLLEHRGQRFLR